MKTNVLAAATAAMAFSAACAWAANPFVDVPTDSWAYQSVAELANAGIIQGVDGQYFEGQRNITRYEAAEMVAKAMAHMDEASVEQRALISKLADEYADELNGLGVRISDLEQRVGHIAFSGDSRVRFQHSKDTGLRKDDSWDYRIRLRGKAQVNDRTTATLGISTGDISFGSNGAASEDSRIYADDVKVDYNFGSPHWNLSLGRTDAYVLGGDRAYGYQYGDVFDRAELTYQHDHFAVTGGYGKFKEGDIAGSSELTLDGVKTGYGQVEGFFGNGSAAGVYYNTFSTARGSHETAAAQYDVDDLWGAYVNLHAGSKWDILANYESISRDASENSVKDPHVWIGKLTYGSVSEGQQDSWDAWLEYIDAEKGALIGGSTNSWRDDSVLNGVTSWGIGFDYALGQNVVLTMGQTFGTKGKNGLKNPSEFTDVEVNFFF